MARDYQIRERADGFLNVIVTVDDKPPKTVPKRFRTPHAAKNYIARVRAKATGRTHPLNALGAQRRATIMARLTEAADNGEPMPSNAALAKLIGLHMSSGYKTALSKHLGALERAGLIKIARGAHATDRRVTICATGKRTGWQIGRTRQPKKPSKLGVPGAYTFNRSLAGGYSDTFLYGALAEAVRACRRRGDVVFRDPRDKTVVLINGTPGDVRTRAAWHAARL